MRKLKRQECTLYEVSNKLIEVDENSRNSVLA